MSEEEFDKILDEFLFNKPEWYREQWKNFNDSLVVSFYQFYRDMYPNYILSNLEVDFENAENKRRERQRKTIKRFRTPGGRGD